MQPLEDMLMLQQAVVVDGMASENEQPLEIAGVAKPPLGRGADPLVYVAVVEELGGAVVMAVRGDEEQIDVIGDLLVDAA